MGYSIKKSFLLQTCCKLFDTIWCRCTASFCDLARATMHFNGLLLCFCFLCGYILFLIGFPLRTTTSTSPSLQANAENLNKVTARPITFKTMSFGLHVDLTSVFIKCRRFFFILFSIFSSISAGFLLCFVTWQLLPLKHLWDDKRSGLASFNLWSQCSFEIYGWLESEGWWIS